MAEYQHPIDDAFLTRVNFYVETLGVSAILCGIELNRPDYIKWGINRLQKEIHKDKR